MRILELDEAATTDQIKRAYRRLVQQNHPDKHRGDEAAQKKFIKISVAYQILMEVTRALEEGKKVGACCRCRKFGEVIEGSDGLKRCPACVLAPAWGRLLPLPAIIVVKCIATFLLLATTTYLLIMASTTKDLIYAITAFIAGIAALASLAHTCLTVVYCINPREQNRYRNNMKFRKK